MTDDNLFDLPDWDEATWDALEAELGDLRLPTQYCPIEPTAKQEVFLRREELEVFFGGAAGPGKSFGLLEAATQYVDVPGYHALILRTVLQDHYKQKALIPVAHSWFGGTDAHWNGSLREWTFPSGATVGFGYVRTLADLSHFKGPAYAFLGFDELTEFDEQVYLGMSRVLRDAPVLDPKTGARVPLRKRAASNPGGPGHAWVKSRFISEASREKNAVFIPAKITDNPHMDYDEYMLSLAHLTPIDQMRLINGDWDVMEEGGKFHREKFEVIDPDEMTRSIRAVRYWDLAGTKPSPSNTDPDWTVGLRLDVDKDGTFTVRDIVRVREEDSDIENIVKATATQDGRGVPIFIEQDPGQAGKSQLANYKRRVLQGFICNAGLTRVAGKSASKEVRARPVAAAVGNGLVRIIRQKHLHEFLDEVSIFPNGNHDDIVDALSGAHTALTAKGGGNTTKRTSVATGRIPGVGVGRGDSRRGGEGYPGV